MGRRKCVFSKAEAPSMLLNDAEDTGSGTGPSTSGQKRMTSLRPHSSSWRGSEAAAAFTWVWVPPGVAETVPAASARAASAAVPATAAAAAGMGLPWRGARGGGDSGGGGGRGGGGGGDGQQDAAGARALQPLHPWRLPRLQLPDQPRVPRSRYSFNCAHGGSSSGGGDGDREASCCSRPLLLASLSTSLFAARRADGSSGGGAGGLGPGIPDMTAATAASAAAASGGASSTGSSRRAPRSGLHLPQLSIMRLPGSPSFAEEQALAEELLDYHTCKHGGFPRPCPRCKSHDFLVRRPDAAATAQDQHTANAGGAPRAAACNPASMASAGVGGIASADGGGGAGDGGAGGVEWRSRPLRCETCGCWVHLGCVGVELVEEVPPRPWFHCRACRETYLRVEAAAERNPHPSSASPTHALYLLTSADHHAARDLPALLPPAAAAGGAALLGGGALAAGLPSWGSSGRGPTGAVLPLLAQGFNADAIQGFGQPAREYDGGKYSAVLLSRGQPVAAATFNVFGADAQLCLLATAVQHRLKGNGSALVADLEALLANLGVSRLLVQARGVALPLWLGRLGYSVVAPQEAEQLHRRLPIAYYDCALLQKQLLPLSPPL